MEVAVSLASGDFAAVISNRVLAVLAAAAPPATRLESVRAVGKRDGRDDVPSENAPN